MEDTRLILQVVYFSCVSGEVYEYVLQLRDLVWTRDEPEDRHRLTDLFRAR